MIEVTKLYVIGSNPSPSDVDESSKDKNLIFVFNLLWTSLIFVWCIVVPCFILNGIAEHGLSVELLCNSLCRSCWCICPIFLTIYLICFYQQEHQIRVEAVILWQ